MALPQPAAFDAFEERAPLRAALPYLVGLALLIAAGWYLYTQFRWIGGVPVKADPKTVAVVPLPPTPPPPPPPPPPEEKPPEPTEQPQPSPAEAQPSKAAPEPAAAPMQINAPAEAGADNYGLRSGAGGGRGAPASTGTCLAPPCGGGGGGGVSVGVYTDYLTTTLQERVRRDERLSRLVFSADLAVSVTRDGRLTGVRLVDRRGGGGEQAARQLVALLEAVRGLNPPPSAMSFPQKITVQGRRPF